LAAPSVDTLKQVDEMNRITTTLNRDEIWQAQTPQLFRLGLLCEALKNADDRQIPVTDEASAMEASGYYPRIIPARYPNPKLTYATDLATISLLLKQQAKEVISV
jgi:2-C-methyl-D-erythritol 4-phosphate cytidylyltransferase